MFMIFEGPMIMAAALALVIVHPGICLAGVWKAAGWKNAASTETPRSELPKLEGIQGERL